MRTLALLLLTAGLAAAGPTPTGKRLVFVQAIWRHGDRAPGGLPYPHDANGEERWPRGWNQLTNEGMRQLRDLGAFFRQRYAGRFVNATYRVREVAVVSTDKERALVSAQAMLHGFFPPAAAADRFDAALDWQPIPVHSAGVGAEDPLLKPTAFACPRFDRKVRRVRETFAERLFADYAELFAFLRSATGFPQFGLEELKQLGEVAKEIDHRLPQPAWIDRRWPQYANRSTVELIVQLGLRERLTRLSTPELVRLRGGFLLGDWLKRADRVARGKQRKPQKMLLYSSHDGTLQSFLHVLGVADGVQIPYGGCVLMEIFADARGEHTAKLLFRHGHELSPLKVRGCGEECPVERLITLLEKNAILSLKQMHRECEREFCKAPIPDSSKQAAREKKQRKQQQKKLALKH
ncbi:Testicular acid phosphatase-like protein [Aphelenchoides fujianensis]|nr:Testicular acid phosphatase-like protein [Aphelenchoides fujianensis]